MTETKQTTTQTNQANQVNGNNVPAQSTYKTALAKIIDTYTNMIVDTAKQINIEYSEYQKICVANAIAKMQEILVKEGLTFRDVDPTNITSTLQTIAMLQLNTAAIPRECYLQLRKVKIKQSNPKTEETADVWTRQFEFGIEGDGNDAILRYYGVDIKKVHQCWIVREGDEFTYPSYNGLELVAPTWVPKSYTGKVVRVVYPIEKNDGTIEYHIAEREGVVKNLLAHINNNMMNETFGICDSKFKATEKQLEQIEEKKQEIFKKLEGKSLDQILDDKTVHKWISPAWLNPHSREDMILRKLRNNAVKKIPKDFRNAFAALEYEKTYEDYEQYRQPAPQPDPEAELENQVENEANKKPLETSVKFEDGSETKAEVVDKPKPKPQEQSPKTQTTTSQSNLFGEVPF